MGMEISRFEVFLIALDPTVGQQLGTKLEKQDLV